VAQMYINLKILLFFFNKINGFIVLLAARDFGKLKELFYLIVFVGKFSKNGVFY